MFRFPPILLFLLGACLSGLGQQYLPGNFEKLSFVNGLSDNLVTSIIQDDDGFIWVGTLNGLNRYDGRIFESFYATGRDGGLTGNRIRRLKKFSGNHIGVLSAKGFSIFNAAKLTAQPFEVPDTTHLWFNMNDMFDAVELPGERYAFTGQTGFYVAGNNGKLINRYEHFTLTDKEKAQTRIFFGNNLFLTDNDHVLLYYQDVNTAIYNIPQNRFSLNGSQTGNNWQHFAVPKQNWTIKKQINRSEYLFLPLVKDSIYYYNSATHKKTASPLPFKAELKFFWDSYINFINDSVFAVNCPKNGFYLFTLSRSTGKISVNPQVQLPGFECREIFCDREGRLWIGTSEGILMEKKTATLFRVHSTRLINEDSATSYFNSSVYKYGGKLFVGRYALNNGLLVYDPKTFTLRHKINFYNGNNRFNGVLDIQSYHPDTLWLSTENGLLWVNTNTYQYGPVQVQNRFNTANLKLSPSTGDGIAWLTNYYNNTAIRYLIQQRTFEVYNQATPTVFPPIRPKYIVHDAYGDTWIGGNGLCRWNHKKQQFDTLITQFAGKYPKEHSISSMTAGHDGSLWLTTPDNNLLEYRIKEKRWIHYDEQNGLPNGYLGTFSPAIGNQFWFGSGSNLNNFHSDTKKTTIFGAGTGLPAKNLTSERDHFFYDQDEGVLYFAVRDYVTRFPARFTPVAPVQCIIIKEAVINKNERISFPADTLRLDYNNNQVSVLPGLIDFENGKQYQFSYKLDDAADWNQLGLKPEIFLNKLSPGKHRLTIRVAGMYTEIRDKTMIIIVQPPFWKTNWFYLLCGLFLGGVLFLFYRVRINRIRKKASLNQQLAEYEMKALHAQMNPHFIFNCLNSIKGMIINNRNREAAQYLTKFSSLVRQNLEHSRKPFITLEQNIEYIIRFLEIEQFRFADFYYSIETAPDLHPAEIKIAPMLLQPLVENAIWHGLQEIKGDKKVQIRFKMEAQHIICEVEDNGIGINRSLQKKQAVTHQSLGIENITERIKLLNDKFKLDYSISITDRSEQAAGVTGTLVTLRFSTD